MATVAASVAQVRLRLTVDSVNRELRGNLAGEAETGDGAPFGLG